MSPFGQWSARPRDICDHGWLMLCLDHLPAVGTWLLTTILQRYFHPGSHPLHYFWGSEVLMEGLAGKLPNSLLSAPSQATNGQAFLAQGAPPSLSDLPTLTASPLPPPGPRWASDTLHVHSVTLLSGLKHSWCLGLSIHPRAYKPAHGPADEQTPPSLSAPCLSRCSLTPGLLFQQSRMRP